MHTDNTLKAEGVKALAPALQAMTGLRSYKDQLPTDKNSARTAERLARARFRSLAVRGDTSGWFAPHINRRVALTRTDDKAIGDVIWTSRGGSVPSPPHAWCAMVGTQD